MKKLLTYIFLICIISFSITGCVFSGSDKKTDEANRQEECESDNTDEETINKDEEIKDTDNKEEVKDKENNNSNADNKAIVKKVVVIDPGHGNHSNMEKEKQSPDSNVMKIKDGGGAEGVLTKSPEYAVNMKVALKLKSLLEKNNISVIMTKTSDSESPGNIERAEVGNRNNAALEIRIHCDSSERESVKGASMLVPAKTGYAAQISEVSRVYGEKILNKLVQTCGMSNRGVIERSDLTGFNWSKVPVVLIEMGFMSNKEEDKLLSDDGYQNKLAKGLSDGIVQALSS